MRMIEHFEGDSAEIQSIIDVRNYKESLTSEVWKSLRIACFAHYFQDRRAPRCFVCGRLGRLFDTPSPGTGKPGTLKGVKTTKLRGHHLRYPAIDPSRHLVPICQRCHNKVNTFNIPLGLSPEQFRRQMLEGFQARKLLLRAVEATADARVLVDWAREAVPKVDSGFCKRKIPRPPGRLPVREKVPGYIRWLLLMEAANTEDHAADYLFLVVLGGISADSRPLSAKEIRVWGRAVSSIRSESPED